MSPLSLIYEHNRIEKELLESFGGNEQKLIEYYEEIQKNLFNSIKQKCLETMYDDLQEK